MFHWYTVFLNLFQIIIEIMHPQGVFDIKLLSGYLCNLEYSVPILRGYLILLPRSFRPGCNEQATTGTQDVVCLIKV